MNWGGPEFCVLAVGAVAVAAALTLAMRKFALSRGLLDVPNARSSHQLPTPRGGGVAIVATAMIAFSVLAALHWIEFNVFAALAGGVAVAWVGFQDDRHALPAAVRLAAHVAAALWALAWLGGLPALRFGDQVVTFSWGGVILGVLGIVWVLNLFNFMDGIDGIAASEAVFVVWCGALLTGAQGALSGPGAAAVIFGAACLGFLYWNWPPARIFMGDVGSGYVGYVVAVLALAAGRDNSIAVAVWLTLGGLFFADATVTLVRRFLRRERLHEAHRSHAYQWLSRKWGSHRRVTMAAIALNVFWLLPCAWLETLFPRFAAVIAVTALAVVAVVVLGCGAGRSEQASGG